MQRRHRQARRGGRRRRRSGDHRLRPPVEAGLELAVLSDTTRRLGEILFPQASLVNPVDVAGSTDANPALLATCMEIVAEDENVDAVFLVGMFGGYQHPLRRRPAGRRDAGAESMIELGRRSTKPLVIYSLYAPIKPPALRRLHEAGLPVYASIEHAVSVLRALGERGIYLRDAEGRAPLRRHGRRPRPKPCLSRQRTRSGSLRVRSEGLLRAHGVQVAPEIVVHDADELAEVARQFGDQALVMKVVSRTSCTSPMRAASSSICAAKRRCATPTTRS